MSMMVLFVIIPAEAGVDYVDRPLGRPAAPERVLGPAFLPPTSSDGPGAFQGMDVQVSGALSSAASGNVAFAPAWLLWDDLTVEVGVDLDMARGLAGDPGGDAATALGSTFALTVGPYRPNGTGFAWTVTPDVVVEWNEPAVDTLDLALAGQYTVNERLRFSLTPIGTLAANVPGWAVAASGKLSIGTKEAGEPYPWGVSLKLAAGASSFEAIPGASTTLSVQKTFSNAVRLTAYGKASVSSGVWAPSGGLALAYTLPAR